MRSLIYTLLFIGSFLMYACSGGGKDENAESPEKTRVNDSISKLEQRIRVDSMKRLNPLLILPPDSTYSGEYIDKYPTGVIKFRGSFRFGERHGQWFSFYPNGLMWSEMHYDKGLRHGPNNTFYETGKMRYSGFYKNDKVDSTWTYYDSLGKVIEVLKYKDARLLKRETPKLP